MANDQKVKEQLARAKEYGWSYDDHLKHWRSWGSWFSWGSPVGLGIFFLACAGTIWVLGRTFHW